MAFIDDLLSAGGYQVDPRTSPYFGAQDMGSGSGTLGSGSPLGWVPGIENLPDSSSWYTPGSGSQDPIVNREAFMQYLDQKGYQLFEKPLPDGSVERAILDRSGQPVMAPQRVGRNDQAFWNAAMAATAFVGTGVATGWELPTFTSLGSGAGDYGASMATAGGGTAAGGAAGTNLGVTGLAGGSGGASVAAGGGGGLGVGGWAQGISGGLSVLGGLYGLSKADDVEAAMDPFGPYRADYAAKLKALEGNPGAVAQLPGFRAGIKALESSTAAGGYFGSGNAAAALTEYGGNFYQAELARLAQLAGAGATPGAGAVAGANITGQSLAGIGYGVGQLAKLFGG